MTNRTHDPARKSWVESANVPACEVPLQNLPFGVFRGVVGQGETGAEAGPGRLPGVVQHLEQRRGKLPAAGAEAVADAAVGRA